jgi:hypothetical protein
MSSEFVCPVCWTHLPLIKTVACRLLCGHLTCQACAVSRLSGSCATCEAAPPPLPIRIDVQEPPPALRQCAAIVPAAPDDPPIPCMFYATFLVNGRLMCGTHANACRGEFMHKLPSYTRGKIPCPGYFKGRKGRPVHQCQNTGLSSSDKWICPYHVGR